MSRILKFILLFFFLFSNLYSAIIGEETFDEKFNDPYRGYQNEDVANREFPFLSQYSSRLLQSNIEDISFLGANEYGNEFFRIGNKYYSVTNKGDYIFYKNNAKGTGYYLYDYAARPNSIFILQFYSDGFETKKGRCVLNGNHLGFCGVEGLSNSQEFEFSYFNQWYIEYKATCDPSKNEIFSKKFSRCASCPAGQSWDDKTEKCFVDCTDIEKNKWGSPNGCLDCSGEKTMLGAASCACRVFGFGTGAGSAFQKNQVHPDQHPAIYTAICNDGVTQQDFWNPEYKEPKKPDNNSTKPDKPNPDKPKDPSKPGDGGGNSGGGSGGGGSGKEDKPDNPKPNPKPDKPKDNNGTIIVPGGGGGNNDKNKNDEPKFNPGDFDDGGLDKERNNLYDGIKNHINDSISKFDGIRDGIDQFIKNVQGKGFEKVQANIKQTCPMKKELVLPNGRSETIIVDYCKTVEPASEISYYAFYVGFAVGGFLLFLKLLVFSI